MPFDCSLSDTDMNHHQDIARHSFCDMVNDFDRNNKYAGAIERVVQAVKARDGYAYVFDVGCGSGLLSMLAMKYGADYVYAVEQNVEMSKTAKVILEQNGFEDDRYEIVVTRLENVKRPQLKRSFPNKETAFPNVVTAELFDSEMIGEDALRIYQAIKPLVSTNALFVPTSGTIHIQLVNSPFFNQCHALPKEIEINGRKLEAPVEVLACSGASEIQDLHLDRFSSECSTDLLSDPLAVFEFDFTSITTATIKECKRIFLQLKRPIYPKDKLCIVFWWSSRMDIFSTSEMTTAPHWILGVDERWSPWREHWLPVVYHFPIKQYEHFLYKNHKKDKIELYCGHDEFKFEFNLIDLKSEFEHSEEHDHEQNDNDNEDNNGDNNNNDLSDLEESFEFKMEIFEDDCVCDIHRCLGRTGMFQFNNQKRFTNWLHGFTKALDSSDTKNDIKVLFVGDFSPLPFLIAQDKRIKKVFIDVSDINGQHKIKCYREFLKSNSTTKIIFYSNGNIHFDILAVDEFLTSKSILSEQFSHELIELITNKQPEQPFITYPQYVNIHLNYISFEQLYKNYRQVETTQEFNMNAYDKLVMNSRTIVDDLPDFVNCSEYRSTMSSQSVKNILKLTPVQVLTKDFHFNLKLRIPDDVCKEYSRKHLASVLWLSFQDGDYSFSYNSPSIDSKRFCKWPSFTYQFVQFFDQTPGIENIPFNTSVEDQRLRLIWNKENRKFIFFLKKSK